VSTNIAGVKHTSPEMRPGEAGTNKREWRLSSSLRKCVLVLHAVSGIGWMGVDIALFLLLLNARTTSNATEAISGYTAVSLIVPIAVPPLCLGVLGTGLLLGWGSPWGLVRYWWVFIKLLLSLSMTILVFVSLVPTIQSMPSIANSGTADAVRERLGPLTIQLMFPPAVSFGLLGVAAVLSIFKPRGLTPWSAVKK
jgi:uncharacterized membrane protein